MLSVLIAATAALVRVSDADAQSRKKSYYVRGNLGLQIPGDVSTPPSGNQGALSGKFDAGYSLHAAGGYQFNNVLGLEAEFGIASSEIDAISPGTGGTGDLLRYHVMANGVAELGRGKVKPYVGAGVGGAVVEVDQLQSTGGNFDGDAATFAYQFLAGVGYQISPKVTIGVDYRYFQHGDLEVDLNNSAPQDDNEFDASHHFTLGVQSNF